VLTEAVRAFLALIEGDPLGELRLTIADRSGEVARRIVSGQSVHTNMAQPRFSDDDGYAAPPSGARRTISTLVSMRRVVWSGSLAPRPSCCPLC
jgi:hypothetical protein